MHILELRHLKRAEVEGASPEVIRWARFFLAESKEEIENLAKEDSMMRKASEQLGGMALSSGFLTAAELRADAVLWSKIHSHMEREQGRREGREEGREEGGREGAVAILLELLEGRFGPLEPALVERVRLSTAAELPGLIKRVSTASTAADVVADT